jgi:PAS domain S-box-containing protein
MGMDVTERKRAEAAVTLERKRFETILDGLPAMICLLTPGYEVAFANHAFRKHFGEAQGRKCYEYCFGESTPCAFCESFQVLKTGKPHDWEVVTKENRCIHAFDSPFTDVDGSALILEMNLDVTQQREAERRLRQSTAELKEAQRVAQLGSWSMDVETGDVTWSEELYEMLGLDPSQPAVAYSQQKRIFTPESWARLTTHLAETVRTGLPYELELETLRRDGTHGWMLARGEPVCDENGMVKRLRGVALDITKRKEAERRLERVNRTLEAMGVCADALMRCSHEADMLQRVCDAVVEVAGYRMAWVGYAEHDEDCTVRPLAWAGHEDGYVLGAHISWADVKRGRGPTGVAIRTGNPAICHDIAHDPHLNPWKEQALKRGYQASIVLPLRTEAESFGAISIYAAEREAFDTRECQLLEELARNMSYAITALRAHAELQQLNQQLDERVRDRTSELQAANRELEAFSYSVSHDLRAPLRHISGFSKILSEEYGPTLPQHAQHQLQRIQEGTRRMGELIDDLLNLSRVGRHELQSQVISLENLVRQVMSDLEPECESRDIHWKIENLPCVACDGALLKQVFQNLLSNALKFTRPRRQAVIEVGCGEQQGVPAIFVRDNGVGFNMKYAGKLFGVFQRMHRTEDFEGTGVGLATVQRIVQKHGGRVWAEAELDKGATFYFTLAALGNTREEPAAKEEIAHELVGD